jgi:hypothetical protein
MADFGITQERFTQLVQERGYSVKEEQQRVYYPSPGWRDETFLYIMDGETVKSYYNKEVLAHWVPESVLVEVLNEYADQRMKG